MKTLLFTALLLTNTAFASERLFQCSARYVFGNKEKATLTGTITSQTTLADVVYTIDDQTEFNASILTPAKKNINKRFAFTKQFKVDGGSYTLIMPEKMDSTYFFTAIVGNEKTFEKLECEIVD